MAGGNFGDVHKAFNPRFEFYEGTKLCNATHRAAHRCTEMVFLTRVLPGAGHEVADGETNFSSLSIDLLDHHVYFLAKSQ